MSELFQALLSQAGIAVAVLVAGAVALYRKLQSDQTEHQAERRLLSDTHAAEREAWIEERAALLAEQSAERARAAEEIARLNREHLEFVQSLIPRGGDS